MKGAVSIAQAAKISDLAIASTIIAFGTNLPTLTVNLALIFFATNGAAAAIGNTMGTSFVNIGLALGIPAFILTIVTKYQVFEKEIPILFAVNAIITGFVIDGGINWVEGMILLMTYLITTLIVYQYAMKEKVKTTDQAEMDVDTSTIDEVKTKGLGTTKSILYIVGGSLLMIVFSVLLAQLSPILSELYHISEYVLGLTVIGIGTSLPTIVTSIRAAKKGYVDIILGNVFGGTIANMTLGLGIPALVKTLQFDQGSISDIYLFNIYCLTVLFLILVEMKLLGGNKTLSRVSGIIIVLIFISYLVFKMV
ncbi:MAG: calcium/sodium antiporter [Candidatus Dojkabacteria bacterium]